mmetsp:Transcript_59916/g.133530  ORF Transcript_59916/g.133530 Transcript_59916/m.133530 type:complete len:207 (-) Transcript_59916:771-1391(-)
MLGTWLHGAGIRVQAHRQGQARGRQLRRQAAEHHLRHGPPGQRAAYCAVHGLPLHGPHACAAGEADPGRAGADPNRGRGHAPGNRRRAGPAAHGGPRRPRPADTKRTNAVAGKGRRRRRGAPDRGRCLAAGGAATRVRRVAEEGRRRAEGGAQAARRRAPAQGGLLARPAGRGQRGRGRRAATRRRRAAATLARAAAVTDVSAQET